MNVTVFSSDYFEDLVTKAMSSPRRRRHRNAHADYADPCQRLFNAIEPDSYLQPHRHLPDQGAETMLAVRGLFALLIFDDSGEIAEFHLIGAARDDELGSAAAGAEIPPMRWHTILALKPASILLEVKAGPFDPGKPKELAPWAPEEGSQNARTYHQLLLEEVRRRL